MEKMPKSRPIIFNSESVRAILDGRKTQTRRVLKHQPSDWATNIFLGPYIGESFTYGKEGYWLQASDDYYRLHGLGKCPYGIPGDKLWVRETWASLNYFDVFPPSELPDYAEIVFKATEEDHMMRGDWRASIHLPKKFSRITLEIKDVRVERVQEISEVGAIDEGMMALSDAWVYKNFPDYGKDYQEWREKGDNRFPPPWGISPRQKFAKFWDIIDSKKGFGWETDPFVFVLELERNV